MSFIIKNRDDYNKLEKYKKTKEKLFEKRLQEKLGNQSFYYDMKQVFEPSIEAQEVNTKKIIKSQELTQKAITEGNENLQNTLTTGLDILNNLVKSNMIDSNIVRTLSNLMNNKNKSQFSINYNTSDNSFTINPINPQKIKIEGYNMIFKNGNIYDLRNKDLAYFLSYTNMNENNITDDELIYKFCKDVKYDLNLAGDKRSNRYRYIKKLSLKTSGEGVMLDQWFYPD